MKKVFYSMGIAALAAVALTSCHHTILHDAFEVPESFDETKEYTIEFWSKNDSDANQIQVYEDAITEFNTYYPNIHVELRNFTSYPDIYREVLLNLATDSTPNVCISYPDNVATYLESENSVISLSYLLEDKKFGLDGSQVKYPTIGKDGIVSKFKEEGKIGDEYYTIPFMRSTEALYINKTYVERLGFTIPEIPTWDWLWEVAEAAVAERADGTTDITSKTDPSKDFKPLIYKSSDNWFIQYAKQSGMDYTKDGKATMFNETTKDFLLDLKQKCLAGEYEVFENSSHYPGDLINVWDAIFGIDSTAGSTWIGFDSPQGTDSLGYEAFETELTVIPQQKETGEISMISQGPSICVFNKEDSGEVLASWLFAQFLLSDSVQMAYQKTEGYLPVTNSCLNSQEFKDYLNGDEIYSGAKKAKELLMNHINDTFITEVFNGSANVRSAAGGLIKGVSTTTSSFSSRESLDKLYTNIIKNNNLADLVATEEDEETPVEETKTIGKEGLILLSVLGGVWVCIGIYVLAEKRKNPRRKTV